MNMIFATATAAALTAAASGEYFTIGPVPGNAPQGFSQVFSKHVDVLGAHVYASRQAVRPTPRCCIRPMCWRNTSTTMKTVSWTPPSWKPT